MKNYNGYSANQKQYMNRAERRKNKIKNEKIPSYYKCNKEELEKIIKKELYELIHEPYSETLKRERYKRLEPYVKEYERQKALEKAKTLSEPMKAYKRQREDLKYNPTYQKLMRSTYSLEGQEKRVDYKRQRAINAYQAQMVSEPMKAYRKQKEELKCNPTYQKLMKNTSTPEKQKVARNYQAEKARSAYQAQIDISKRKKGLWARIVDFFKPSKPVEAKAVKKTSITPPKIQQEVKHYKTVTDKVWDEFGNQFRQYKNYCQEIKGYQHFHNGRNVAIGLER